MLNVLHTGRAARYSSPARFAVAADIGMALSLQDLRYRRFRLSDREVLGLAVAGRLAGQGLVFANNRNRFFAVADTAAVPSGAEARRAREGEPGQPVGGPKA